MGRHLSRDKGNKAFAYQRKQLGTGLLSCDKVVQEIDYVSWKDL